MMATRITSVKRNVLEKDHVVINALTIVKIVKMDASHVNNQ